MINYIIALAVILFLGTFIVRKIHLARVRRTQKEDLSCSGGCSGCSGSCC